MVRISMPISARSGTELMLSPPWMVPTLRVGAPSTAWRATLKSKACKRRHRARRLVDGVDALLRHRAVRGHAGRFRLQPERALVADQRPVAGRLRHDEARRLRRAGLCPAPGPRRRSSRSPRPAVMTSSTPGVACEPIRQRHAGGDEGGDAALHVRRAAAIELAVGDLARKRIDRPGPRAQRHGVEMAGESERRTVRRAADAGD